jgi:primosomal protein N' (replication factor Y)
VVRVVPDVTGLDKQFDYTLPDALAEAVTVGTVVRVPLGGRRVGGWVVGTGLSADGAPVDRLRAIAKVTGHGPSPELVDLAAWASHRWAAGRLRPFLKAATPPVAVTALPRSSRSGAHPEPVSTPAAGLLGAGGGVLRLPPSTDPVPVVLAAARCGATLVVVPSVDEARLLGARVRRAGLTVAVLPRDWGSAAAGVDVVIGARAAAWASVPDGRAFVVLDEHDESLQEERSPTWHARDVMIERAHRAGAPCLLVSPVPSLAALAWAGDRVVRPSRNEERTAWPILEVIDRSKEAPGPSSPVTARLLRALSDPGQRVVCVLNAPGRARRLVCRSCHAVARCERCQAGVNQGRDGLLHCARCGTDRPVVCQVCGSTALVPLRPGTAALREQLEAAARRPVVEVVGTDPGPPAEAGVYVGTEAVLHRVQHADVVAFLDIDAELLAPRFRADEEALALLARAARLVGPRAGGGRLIVQTRLPHHEVLDAVLHADPGRLVPVALARRVELRLPPAAALAVVSGPGADQVAAALELQPGLAVSGPSEHRYLVRAPDADALADGFAAAPRPRGVRIQVDPPRV